MTIKNAFYEREVEWHEREAQWKTIIEDLTERNAKLVAALDAMTKDRDMWKKMAEASLAAARDFNRGGPILANQQSTEKP